MTQGEKLRIIHRNVCCTGFRGEFMTRIEKRSDKLQGTTPSLAVKQAQ